MPEDSALIAEQLRHTVDLLRADINTLKCDNDHMREIFETRLITLEKAAIDYEARLRALQESSTQFKFLASLATGGGLLSLIVLLKTLVGN